MIVAVDRAGFVGEDGETHQGLFDVSLLQRLPNTTVYSPATYWEMGRAFYNAIYKDDNLVVIRYPRGRMPENSEFSELKSSDFEIIGNENAKIAIVTYGRLFFNAVEALKIAGDYYDNVKIIKLNRIKPLPENAVEAAIGCEKVLFFEEGMKGGGIGEKFGCDLLIKGFGGKYRLTAVEDEFVAHASVSNLMEKYSMSAEKMAALIEKEAAI